MEKNDEFSSGRVAPEKIEEQIISCQQLGLSVFFVGITAGTTVLGAFDPIEDVAQICRKYKIWLHVDVNSDLLYLFESKIVSFREHGVVQPYYHPKRNIFFKVLTSKYFSSLPVSNSFLIYK